MCCPLPLPPPSPWETKSFRPAPLILYRFLSTSSLYSLSPLFILILSYHIYSIHNIIPLKCFRYCLTHIISIPLPSPIPLPPPPLPLRLVAASVQGKLDLRKRIGVQFSGIPTYCAEMPKYCSEISKYCAGIPTYCSDGHTILEI